MKTVEVVAAVICDSLNDKKMIFATARGYGDYCQDEGCVPEHDLQEDPAHAEEADRDV